MPITDLQVAALRALLSQDMAEHDRLLAELGRPGVHGGYYPLVTAAFGLAVQDRFADADVTRIAQWLQFARMASGHDSAFDLSVAARLIAWILGRGENDLEFSEQFVHQTMLLGMLMDERRPDDAELDAFVARAREYADGVGTAS